MPDFYLVMRHVRDTTPAHEKTYTGPLHGWQEPYLYSHMEGSLRSRSLSAVLRPNPHYKRWLMPEKRALQMREELRAHESCKDWNVWAIEA